jgi:hypothetical protein
MDKKSERIEEDPRTALFDALRGFFLQAIAQQRVMDRTAAEQGTEPAGFLLKSEFGYLKIHLRAPAEDMLLSGAAALESAAGDGENEEDEPSVPMWARIPLPSGFDPEVDDLEELALHSDTILLHAFVPGEEPEEFASSHGHFSPVSPSVESIAEALGPANEALELDSAAKWLRWVSNCDIRTIAATRTEAA